MIRYGVVRGGKLTPVENYLPSNYKVIGRLNRVDDANSENDYLQWIVIAGEDNAGWTLDGFVIPRLYSGIIPCVEVDESDWRVIAVKEIPERELQRRELDDEKLEAQRLEDATTEADTSQQEV